jgi:hypothetical protein
MVQRLKLAIVELTGLSKDTLHVYIGLAVFFAVASVSPRRVRSIVPLLAVLALAAAGEVIDMWYDISTEGYWRWKASLRDMLNTLFWPTVIWLLARFSVLFGENSEK